ncbi:MAG: DUF3558 domain-containing protein [Actinomycetota bacterium]|nr:DUF3558 domain-containing protein [Actinomycetota bacterium]
MSAGCGTGTKAPPEAAGPSLAPATSPIPPVNNPRDIAALSRRPCELLSPEQAQRFGLDLPPRQYDVALGDLGCEWITTTRDRERIRSVLIDTFTNNPTLEVAYSKRQGLPFFELTEIAGYPAIVTRANADIASCDIDVKPAERQSFSLNYDSREFADNPQQACEVGKQVAAAVLMNLPPKS